MYSVSDKTRPECVIIMYTYLFALGGDHSIQPAWYELTAVRPRNILWSKVFYFNTACKMNAQHSIHVYSKLKSHQTCASIETALPVSSWHQPRIAASACRINSHYSTWRGTLWYYCDICVFRFKVFLETLKLWLIYNEPAKWTNVSNIFQKQGYYMYWFVTADFCNSSDFWTQRNIIAQCYLLRTQDLIYLFRSVVLGDLDLWVTLTSGSLVLMTQAGEWAVVSLDRLV